MKVLVGFEYSGIVAQAFRNHGHEAYSNDIIPSDVPEFHLQGDFFDVFQSQSWDMIICHPPCTYLSKVNSFQKMSPGRIQKRNEAVELVKAVFSLNCPKIAIENPDGFLNRHWLPPNQICYPGNFGDDHFKRVCLWLKNLPPLISTCFNYTRKSVSNHVNGQMSQEQRSKLRSKFFPGIANAMAVQWGGG
jgi:site-specific DNA-cytosine methylase